MRVREVESKLTGRTSRAYLHRQASEQKALIMIMLTYQQVGQRTASRSRPVDAHASTRSCDKCAWEEKVHDLGSRRICLSQLLDFYARLGERGCPGERTLMPHFDPNRSTTNDVVRHAIIPESRCGHFGKALAQVLPRRPRNRWRSPRPVMVTHHWANSFRDLVAAVVANGLGLTMGQYRRAAVIMQRAGFEGKSVQARGGRLRVLDLRHLCKPARKHLRLLHGCPGHCDWRGASVVRLFDAQVLQ